MHIRVISDVPFFDLKCDAPAGERRRLGARDRPPAAAKLRSGLGNANDLARVAMPRIAVAMDSCSGGGRLTSENGASRINLTLIRLICDGPFFFSAGCLSGSRCGYTVHPPSQV